MIADLTILNIISFLLINSRGLFGSLLAFNLEGIITTTENVTIKFWEVLDEKLKSLKNSKCTLHKIRLYETPRNFVEYYGEK